MATKLDFLLKFLDSKGLLSAQEYEAIRASIEVATEDIENVDTYVPDIAKGLKQLNMEASDEAIITVANLKRKLRSMDSEGRIEFLGKCVDALTNNTDSSALCSNTEQKSEKE